MSQKLKIYTAVSMFVNPQRVTLAILEKGLELDEFEHVMISMDGEQKSWQHRKRNPFGEAPALELPDGTILTESTAVVKYIDETYPGRKIMGETALEKALDQQWDQRIWVHLLYRFTTAFHVIHHGLGPDLELTTNVAWGEHCRKEALATAAMLDSHLSDGRDWIIGGTEPTFSDITLCTAIAFGKFGPMHTDLTLRFEYLDKFWQRWQKRPSFKTGYKDGGGLVELEYLKK